MDSVVWFPLKSLSKTSLNLSHSFVIKRNIFLKSIKQMNGNEEEINDWFNQRND